MSKRSDIFPPHTDLYSKHGAGLLAEHLKRFWQKRGFLAVRVERFQISPGTWGVRSNLVGGFPPRILMARRT
jgi:hypothetical protein